MNVLNKFADGSLVPSNYGAVADNYVSTFHVKINLAEIQANGIGSNRLKEVLENKFEVVDSTGLSETEFSVTIRTMSNIGPSTIAETLEAKFGGVVVEQTDQVVVYQK